MNHLIAITLISLSASAAELPSPEFNQYYVNGSGQKLEAESALVKSVQGETIYKCQTVTAKVSKSGTSIGIRAVKKPRKGGA